MQTPPDFRLEFRPGLYPFISRTLMKQPRPRSHFLAATATSRNWLRLAPRNIRIRLQINFRSPDVSASHHSKFRPVAF
jgi:hypothetical protein